MSHVKCCFDNCVMLEAAGLALCWLALSVVATVYAGCVSWFVNRRASLYLDLSVGTSVTD